MTPELLELLVTREMPFGKYKGRLIADLPGHYLAWYGLARILTRRGLTGMPPMQPCCGWPGIDGFEVSRSLLDREYCVGAVILDVADSLGDWEKCNWDDRR